MLHCNRIDAAMQTKQWSLASGIHSLFPDIDADFALTQERGPLMSKTASVGFAPSPTLLSRLVATLDRLLMAYAEMTIRNGDVPRVGL
jgi:hypothetical protein